MLMRFHQRIITIQITTVSHFNPSESLQGSAQRKFKAAPHLVRKVTARFGEKVAGNTLAAFTRPSLEDRVDTEDITLVEFSRGIRSRKAAR